MKAEFLPQPDLSGVNRRNSLASVAMTVLTADQTALRDAVRELAQEKIAPRAAEIDRKGEFPWDVVELLRQHDFFAAAISRANTAAWART